MVKLTTIKIGLTTLTTIKGRITNTIRNLWLDGLVTFTPFPWFEILLTPVVTLLLFSITGFITAMILTKTFPYFKDCKAFLKDLSSKNVVDIIKTIFNKVLSFIGGILFFLLTGMRASIILFYWSSIRDYFSYWLDLELDQTLSDLERANRRIELLKDLFSAVILPIIAYTIFFELLFLFIGYFFTFLGDPLWYRRQSFWNSSFLVFLFSLLFGYRFNKYNKRFIRFLLRFLLYGCWLRNSRPYLITYYFNILDFLNLVRLSLLYQYLEYFALEYEFTLPPEFWDEIYWETIPKQQFSIGIQTKSRLIYSLSIIASVISIIMLLRPISNFNEHISYHSFYGSEYAIDVSFEEIEISTEKLVEN